MKDIVEDKEGNKYKKTRLYGNRKYLTVFKNRKKYSRKAKVSEE